jgi:hypothetical protein
VADAISQQVPHWVDIGRENLRAEGRQTGCKRRVGRATRKVVIGFRGALTARALLRLGSLYSGLTEVMNTQKEEIINVLEMLSAVSWTQFSKMAAKSKEIYRIPSFIVPLFGLLNLEPLMVPINVEPHTLVILTCDGSTVDE